MRKIILFAALAVSAGAAAAQHYPTKNIRIVVAARARPAGGQFQTSL